MGLVALISAQWTFAPRLWADDVYQVVIKKQEEKKKSRWSLDDWFATKEKMRLMDMWLAMHSASPYEFFLAGDYRSASLPTGNVSGLGVSAAAYATIFGLEGQHESLGGSRQHAIFHLRLFGLQDQGTNLTFQLGFRQQNDAAGLESVRNAFWGGRVGLCLSSYFGIEGLLRHYFDSTPGAGGQVFGGNRYEASAFIDFSVLRVYGTYYSEPALSQRTGFEFGGKLYF